MTILQPAVEFLMLTRLQKIWGNSHDVILGMLLWMHDLPTIPLHSVMHYCPINQHLLARGVLQADPLCSRVLVYHKVSMHVCALLDIELRAPYVLLPFIEHIL